MYHFALQSCQKIPPETWRHFGARILFTYIVNQLFRWRPQLSNVLILYLHWQTSPIWWWQLKSLSLRKILIPSSWRNKLKLRVHLQLGSYAGLGKLSLLWILTAWCDSHAAGLLEYSQPKHSTERRLDWSPLDRNQDGMRNDFALWPLCC